MLEKEKDNFPTVGRSNAPGVNNRTFSTKAGREFL